MRYAAGVKDVLDRTFNNQPLKKDDVIVEVSFASLAAASLESLHINQPTCQTTVTCHGGKACSQSVREVVQFLQCETLVQ